jgi:hypothetical protein
MTARKLPVKKKALPNDGDKISVTIVGVWDDENGAIVPSAVASEMYIDLEEIGVTFEILEAATVYADGDVIKDSDGDVFQRRQDCWVPVGGSYGSYASPNRPFKKAEFK